MELGESITNKFIRVTKDDPNRCQATHKDYQCPFRAVGTFDSVTKKWEGSEYCPRHGGNKGIERESKENQKQYQVAKWEARIGRFAGHTQIKSLRQEIGMMRMVLETRLNRCSDDAELLLASTSISEMLVKLRDLITSCHKIEKDTGQLLDRAQAQTWVGTIINIIAMYVPDPDTLQAMGEDMMFEFDKMLNQNQNAS